MTLIEKISLFNRKRKWNIFLDFIKPKITTTVLDVGFTPVEKNDTENYIEKNYPYPQKITALGIEESKEFLGKYPQIIVVKYDGKHFPFKDKEFDVCWSNAVIEHVGGREAQLLFIKEMKRVSKTTFFTTPNRFFPIEIHTKVPLAHLLPKSLFDKILRFLGKEWATKDYMNLLSLSQIKSLMRDAGINHYIIKKNRLLFFTLDFAIIFGETISQDTPICHPEGS